MMTDIVKDEDRERPIPLVWRAPLKPIVDALVRGEVPASAAPLIVGAVDPDNLRINRENIADYPDALGPLGDAAWQSSVYIWMAGHWDVLIDLMTEDGEISDLVLAARIIEAGDQFMIEPGLIYVP